jgi:hypothetical protein
MLFEKTPLLGQALTTRAKREGRSNDKEDRLRGRRESDRFIVAQGKAQAPN